MMNPIKQNESFAIKSYGYSNSNNINVLYIGSIYPEARGVKIVNSLVKTRKFKVLIITISRKQKKVDLSNPWNADTTKVINVKPIFEKLPPYSIIVRNIQRILKRVDFVPDLIYVRNIFCAPVAIAIAKKFGCPIILDIADNHPEVASEIVKPRILGKIAEKYLNYIENMAINYASVVLFVSDYSRKYVINKHCVKTNSTLIIPNYPTLGFLRNILNSNGEINNKINKSEKVYDAIYVGTLDERVRDLETLAKAAFQLRMRYKQNIKIRIVGFHKERFIKIARKYFRDEHNLFSTFVISDAVPIDEMYSEIQKSKIGLIPHKRGKMTDFTVPNKLWDYIHCNIGILISDNPSLVAALSGYPLYEVYQAGDVNSFIDSFMKLLSKINTNSEKKLRKWYHSFWRTYVWEPSFEKLRNILEKMMTGEMHNEM